MAEETQQATTRPAQESRYEPTVSIVVPARNEGTCIAACVDSLLRQDYPRDRFEVIVVDNGSTDDTAAVLAAYSPRVRIIHEPRPGPAVARNAGIAAGTGEVIAFTDADCVAERDWLAHLVQPLADLKVGVSAGRILAFRPSTEMERYQDVLVDHRASIGETLPTAATANWASRISDIRSLGAFDPALQRGEDSDLSMRLFFAGFTLRYTPVAVVYHRNERTVMRLFLMGCKHGMASVRLARKHAQRYRALGIGRIYLVTYGELFRYLFGVIAGKRRRWSLCAFCFHLGKKLGKIIGSVRYGRLEL